MKAELAALGAAEAKFEAVRRRLETAGSTELQEGLLGRWVESARDKVYGVTKNEFRDDNNVKIASSADTASSSADTASFLRMIQLPSSADTGLSASLCEGGLCRRPIGDAVGRSVLGLGGGALRLRELNELRPDSELNMSFGPRVKLIGNLYAPICARPGGDGPICVCIHAIYAFPGPRQGQGALRASSVSGPDC